MAVPILKRMFKLFLLALLSAGTSLAVFSCTPKKSEPAELEITYRQMTADEARHLMETEKDYIILDVRSEEEFAVNHIPNAIVIPHTELAERAEAELPDKSKLIFVYCRSGVRSKIAAETLTSLGYTNIIEFGGILSWSYETE